MHKPSSYMYMMYVTLHRFTYTNFTNTRIPWTHQASGVLYLKADGRVK